MSKNAYKYHESSSVSLRNKALWPVVGALLLIFAGWLLGNNWKVGPESRLSSAMVDYSLMLSNSASIIGIVVISALCLALLVTRPIMSFDYRLKESLAIIAALIVFGGGGAWLNEYKVKPELNVVRPNIEFLTSDLADNAIDMSAQAFYSREVADRSGIISKALKQNSFGLDDGVKQHWIDQPGFSFPSGHTFIAFFIASFFIFFSSSFLTGLRQSVFYVLLPWALAVGLSRVILFVHRPIDIFAGAVLGVTTGICAWFLLRFVIRKLVQAEIQA